jgi:hypothetical protein
MLAMDEMVRTGNEHHPHCYKTLALLRLYEKSGSPVYFIVEGVGHTNYGGIEDNDYFYDEHSCPTNYVPVEAIFTPDDDDPHGVFEYVRTVWYPRAYDEAQDEGSGDEFLRSLFPETRINCAQLQQHDEATNVNETRGIEGTNSD